MHAHGVPIDLWHAALLMPIIWTFAGFFYAGVRWERARTRQHPAALPIMFGASASSGYTVTMTPAPASWEPAPAKRSTRYDRPLRWVVRLFLRICRIGRRW